MNAYTKTTKGKVIGLVLVLAALTTLIATIVFMVAGETNHALPTGSMFASIISLMATISMRLERKELEARTAARREARARLYA